MKVAEIRCRLVFLLLICVVVLGVPLNAQKPDVDATGVFGRLEYHEQSGDVLGLEVFVVKGRSGYFATVQVAEGVPDDPVVIPITVEGAVVSFSLRVANNVIRYRGTVRADGLYGKFDNNAFSTRDDGHFLLKRGQSYWQR